MRLRCLRCKKRFLELDVRNKFKVAFEGLALALRHKAVLIQVVLGFIAIITGFIIKLDYLEWLVFILCIGIVIAFEIINTTIEKVCDLVDENYNPKIKVIKDMSSAAVLVTAMMALIICLVIFINK